MSEPVGNVRDDRFAVGAHTVIACCFVLAPLRAVLSWLQQGLLTMPAAQDHAIHDYFPKAPEEVVLGNFFCDFYPGAGQPGEKGRLLVTATRLYFFNERKARLASFPLSLLHHAGSN